MDRPEFDLDQFERASRRPNEPTMAELHRMVQELPGKLEDALRPYVELEELEAAVTDVLRTLGHV